MLSFFGFSLSASQTSDAKQFHRMRCELSHVVLLLFVSLGLATHLTIPPPLSLEPSADESYETIGEASCFTRSTVLCYSEPQTNGYRYTVRSLG